MADLPTREGEEQSEQSGSISGHRLASAYTIPEWFLQPAGWPAHGYEIHCVAGGSDLFWSGLESLYPEERDGFGTEANSAELGYAAGSGAERRPFRMKGQESAFFRIGKGGSPAFRASP